VLLAIEGRRPVLCDYDVHPGWEILAYSRDRTRATDADIADELGRDCDVRVHRHHEPSIVLVAASSSSLVMTIGMPSGSGWERSPNSPPRGRARSPGGADGPCAASTQFERMDSEPKWGWRAAGIRIELSAWRWVSMSAA